MKFQEDAAYLGFSAGWGAVRHMPDKTAYGMFNKIADRLWKKQGKGVKQLEKNLSRVRPEASPEEIRELSRLGMRSYFRYWCDAFRLPDWSKEEINEKFEIVGREHIDAARAKGNGAVVALPHQGNWDLAGAWAVLNIGPLTSVAERLKPEKLFERFLKFRTDIGMEILGLGTPNIMNELANRLTEGNHIVALPADRDISRHGVEVDFFGAKTKMPAGPARLALITGAPVLPAGLWYEEDRGYARIYEPIRVAHDEPIGPDAPNQPGFTEAIARITQEMANRFELAISEHPEDWHMLQKLWLEDLPPREPGAK